MMKNGTYNCIICISLLRCWSENCNLVWNTASHCSFNI